MTEEELQRAKEELIAIGVMGPSPEMVEKYAERQRRMRQEIAAETLLSQPRHEQEIRQQQDQTTRLRGEQQPGAVGQQQQGGPALTPEMRAFVEAMVNLAEAKEPQVACNGSAAEGRQKVAEWTREATIEETRAVKSRPSFLVLRELPERLNLMRCIPLWYLRPVLFHSTYLNEQDQLQGK